MLPRVEGGHINTAPSLCLFDHCAGKLFLMTILPVFILFGVRTGSILHPITQLGCLWHDFLDLGDKQQNYLIKIMKAVIQRVRSASVAVNGQLISKIGRGLLVLAGVGRDDTEKDIDTMINRILKAKLFPAENDKQWKRNIQDVDGELLCVSQFTLFGQLKKGKQPDFHEAAGADTARRLYDYFYKRLGENYKPERVKNGVFQAMMDVELINDGPVTIEVDTQLPKKDKSADGNDSSDTKKSGSVEFKLPAELLE
ncbi:D-Tyr tRNAtyr deacylase-like domain-containing protein [Aspergillus aurantiobrunneus]